MRAQLFSAPSTRQTSQLKANSLIISRSLRETLKLYFVYIYLQPRMLRATRDRVQQAMGRHMRQNLTIAVEQDLIRKAKVLAAQRGTSISRLLADELQRLVDSETAYSRARDAALAEIDQGLRLGGAAASRDALHER